MLVNILEYRQMQVHTLYFFALVIISGIHQGFCGRLPRRHIQNSSGSQPGKRAPLGAVLIIYRHSLPLSIVALLNTKLCPTGLAVRCTKGRHCVILQVLEQIICESVYEGQLHGHLWDFKRFFCLKLLNLNTSQTLQR